MKVEIYSTLNAEECTASDITEHAAAMKKKGAEVRTVSFLGAEISVVYKRPVWSHGLEKRIIEALKVEFA